MSFYRISALALALLLVPPIAMADEGDIEARKKQAQTLSDEAFHEMAEKNYASACPKLERAVEVYPEGSGVKNTLASCYEASGRLATAFAQYELTALHAIQSGKQGIAAEASKKAAELKPKLATVTIHVPDALRKLPGVVITRNGIPVDTTLWETAVAVDVGEHVFEGKAPGYGGWSEKVVVAADGTHQEVSVAAPKPVEAPIAVPRLPPPPPPPLPPPALRPWQRPLGIATVGVGAVGLGTGGLLLGLAFGKTDESNAGHCDAQSICDETGLELRHQAVGLRNGAVAAFVVGGVLAASGVVLFVTAPRANKVSAKTTAIHWGIEFAPNRMGIQGEW